MNTKINTHKLGWPLLIIGAAGVYYSSINTGSWYGFFAYLLLLVTAFVFIAGAFEKSKTVWSFLGAFLSILFFLLGIVHQVFKAYKM
jgi:hypothetical protein